MNLLERYSDFVEKVQLHYNTDKLTTSSLKRYCEEVHRDFDNFVINKERNHIIINFKDECKK